MSEEKKRAAHPLDLPAMAVFAANYGLSGEQAARRWSTAVASVREHWRMIADAAIAASGLGDALTELAAQPQPAPGLAAKLDQLRDRLAVLAASLDADALATQPSKKSQIQADAARRIREALA